MEYARTLIEGKVVYMHNMIMEQILGRPLKDDEVVKHKDGNGLNNQRENLELCQKKTRS